MPTVMAINSHCEAASQTVSGFKAQLKIAIKAAVTESMKNMSDVDFMPIVSPPD
jgi:hypothetical protein